MSHPPLSVVVTASGSPDDFAACLDSLRPELGPQDEVVCVVARDRADLCRGLPGRAWLRVLDDESGDQAHRWSVGVAATKHPVVVLLDGDVVGSARWLDQVARAFADPEVVAAGPRCHRSFGPQRADLPEQAMASAGSFKAYAREWRQQHRQELTTVDGLGPVCVAVRRAALVRAGGPTLEMPYEELRPQGRMVVVEGALVAHVGSDRCTLRSPGTGARPLVSASMIVKDEEDVLASCLTALREFADEIVLYDTGSTDRTLEIARQQGARVIEGYWNDHFAEARNRSIARCRGEWIFVVDADEVASGDSAAVRAQLTALKAPAALVPVHNAEGHGQEGRGNLSVRFFRRRGRYSGRLHEQVVDGITGEGLVGPTLPGVELAHSGYTALRSTVKDKDARNLRLAELAVADGAGGHAAALNLARSQILAGKAEEAIAACRRALATGAGGYQQTFLQVLIQAATVARRFDEADAGLAELRELAGSAMAADDLEARVRYAEDDFAAALAVIERMPDSGMDTAFMILGRRQLVPIEIMSLFALERHAEAAQLLGKCLEEGETPLDLAQMTSVLRAGGRDLATIAVLVPRRSLRTLLLAAIEAPVPVVDELLEALWGRYPGVGVILAFAARAGVRLPLVRCLEWAVRLRRHGLAENCTLLALAASAGRTARDRALAAAVALEMFGDDRALPLLAQALEIVPASEATGVLDEMRVLAPGVAAAVEPASVG